MVLNAISKHEKQRGVTLVELMIVVAIMGIIAAIAVPSYQNAVRESHRADVQKLLLQLQLRQEEYRMENVSYATLAQLGSPTSDMYTLTVTDVGAATFTLTATAKGLQTGDTGCTVITLDESMNRTPISCW